MQKLILLHLLLGIALFSFGQQSTDTYFPEATHQWKKRNPSELGLNDNKIKEAVQFAIDNESKANRNLEVHHYSSFGREPFGDAVGPHKERGEPTGIIFETWVYCCGMG